MLLSHLPRHSCHSHSHVIALGKEWQCLTAGKSRQDGQGKKAVLGQGITSHGCSNGGCLELDYAVSSEFYSCAVGNDSAQLHSLHSAQGSGVSVSF